MEVKTKPYIIISLISAIIFGVSAVVLFTIFKDSNKTINFIATILLTIATIIIMWLKFYSDLKPIWVGIVFAIFLFVVFMLVSSIIFYYKIEAGNLVAIPIVFALALLLNLFEKKIYNLLLLIFHR